ncbi:hypothetical protein N431DRAFT_433535 [Stipitochalara longipes BDJ]|nr:hypothetical protein N431DRAFT_433535 [Stipitochalara longipes BDJ]
MVLLDSRICTFSSLFLFLVTKVASQNTTLANTTLSPILLPAPPGPYVTRLRIQVMVDKSRPDPYNSSEKYRRVLTSVFTPVLKSECSKSCNAQYMPPAIAASYDESLSPGEPIFARAQLRGICCDTISPRKSELPILIVSPGFGESRLQFSITAQYIASYGYEVILVDHPGDALLVEFPDGEIVTGFPITTGTIPQRVFVLQVETQDVLFVLDSYSKGTCGASRKYHSKFGMIAHEAVAAQAMLNDSLNGHPGRIAGGVNLDGRIYGPVLTDGLGPGEKSFLLWEPASGPPNVTEWDEWWNTTNKLDPGDWQKELRVENSTQGTLTELAMVVDIAGLSTNNATRFTNILTKYTSAFFDMVLKGKNQSLLSGPSEAYPEVSFVRSSI